MSEHSPHVHHAGCSHDHAPRAPYVAAQKVGRNDPCPCGSGKKHKQCCLKAEASA